MKLAGKSKEKEKIEEKDTDQKDKDKLTTRETKMVNKIPIRRQLS